MNLWWLSAYTAIRTVHEFSQLKPLTHIIFKLHVGIVVLPRLWCENHMIWATAAPDAVGILCLPIGFDGEWFACGNDILVIGTIRHGRGEWHAYGSVGFQK